MQSILNGLWQFPNAKKDLHSPCNSYILERDKEVWLIDPSEDLTPERILHLLRNKPVTRIFLTHVQAEHGAGIAHYPNAMVHVPEGDEYLCKGVPCYESSIGTWQEPWEWETRGLYQGHLGGAKNERPLPMEAPLAETLRPGQTFCGMEVIATPGHGKHAVSLLLPVDGTLTAFCGDLVYEDGQLWNWFDCDWDYGLETGQRSLVKSATRLLAREPKLLCPSHGAVVKDPAKALRTLQANLERALCPLDPPDVVQEWNFEKLASPAPGFLQVTSSIHQWKTGNTIIITSDRGRALVVDDGFCIWKPLPERIREHDAIIRSMKTALNLSGIDYIIPTHYHGDHTEFIPHLARQEGARVIALESIAGPLESPERYNLACSLPWYGTVANVVPIDLRVPEGYVLEWEGLSLEFFHLGGQTRHHLGLQAEIDGLNVLFVGDGWWGTVTRPSPVLCWNEAEPASEGWAYAIDKMIDRKPDLLVCGHGSAVRDPLPLLLEARAAWKERLQAFACINPHSNNRRFFNPFFSPDESPERV